MTLWLSHLCLPGGLELIFYVYRSLHATTHAVSALSAYADPARHWWSTLAPARRTAVCLRHNFPWLLSSQISLSPHPSFL
ncbi:hypothetical protein JB92DRAFT_2872005 [Gautieria morchelliformis]|nr:hypothetical protein JB92DRAFT_2872005 [Gautieria morchelliformis]